MSTSPQLLSTQDFAAKVRAKYPGSYDSLSDDELTSRIVQKHPEYKSVVNFGLSSATRQAIRDNPPKFPEASLNESALAGMTGMPSRSFSPQQRQEFIEGKTAGGLATPGGGMVTAGSGIGDITEGNISKGGHKVISGIATTAMPLLPGAAVAAPARFAATAGAAYLAGKAAKVGAQSFGANEEQQQFAEDLGNVAGGAVTAGAKNPFSLTKTRNFITKTSSAVADSGAGDLIGLIEPRAHYGLRLLRTAAKVSKGMSAEDSAGLSEIVSKHEGPISELDAKLADALSKANALPPEGPTAKFKDVPNLRVQPSQQSPQNLLTKPPVRAAQPQPQGGEFQVVPPEGAQSSPTAIIRNVQGQPVSVNRGIPQNVEPSILRATGQPPIGGRVTPNMEIYNEPMMPPKATKPPTLLDQLREWDQIRKIHSELEDQIGKGQEEVQQWMESHNQKAPGAKKNPGQAAFSKARAAAEGKANAVPVDDLAQGGHAGGGVISAEEATRPGNNYVVSKSGNVTAHGKQFAPESTPPGATHVSVLPDGSFRVNAGQTLTGVQESALRSAIKKPVFTGTPKVPTSDAEMESILTEMMRQMKSNKAKSAKAGDD